ncbi:MAG: lysophospholipid acyltransferase family protein [Christensenellaceae bacterium]
MEKSPERLQILEKEREYERLGYFDRDVENDPPTSPLKAGEVDYVGKKFSSRITNKIANFCARRYFDGCIKRGELVIEDVKGMENYLAVKDKGVVITCNHFSIYDHYAIYKTLQKELGKRCLYKIIREGNYTSMTGLFGFFFRHCNTLPLSENYSVMKEMLSGVKLLLERGEKILIYPEQAMWWNYKKPRPLKQGAFRFSVMNNAPVLPMFITMRETDKLDGSGFNILAYTVHILPAIYPDESLKLKERDKAMAKQNYRMWKEIYESTYGEELTYTTENVERFDL